MKDPYEQLRQARIAQKLSQADLGKKLRLPQSHISKIESHKADIRLSTAIELARLLGLEWVLVPRTLLPAVTALIQDNHTTLPQPRWQIDEPTQED